VTAASPGRHVIRFTDALPWRYVVAVRSVPSVPVRCVQVSSADQLYLAGQAMIPTHNSALALDFARSATIKHKLPTVVFSLEMGRNEITMRLLSAEARVPMHVMRTGQMSDDDWARLARRMSEVADAPLFIDDSPNMSLMEIRAKCRRLKQRHDLKLVIIDYLQLMSSSSRRVENRQQEVSEFSRSLKLLAKELEVPVVALSQLNRGPEQRQDKRPLLSDLRESGCLTGDTRILRADTGAEITLDELMASGARDIPVWSVDEGMRLVPRTLTHAFSSGVREVFRVRMTSGREVHATANHPFLTYGGWEQLGELRAGSRVAIARTTPEPLVARSMPEQEIIMLAHLLGDGSFVRNQPIRYASVDEGNLAAVSTAAEHFGITAIRDDYEAARCTSLRLPAPFRLARGRRNPIAKWLDSFGLFGLRSHEKFVPDPVFSLPKSQLALFLRHLWATDGSVTVAMSGNVRIYFGTTSERLARQLQTLLLRFGIVSRLHAVGNTYGHPQWTVDVTGVDDQIRFLDEIGVHGLRSVSAAAARARLREMKAAGRFDTIPSEVWGRVRELLTERSMTRSRLQLAVGTRSSGDLNGDICPSRSRLRRIAEVLGDAQLEMMATNDIFWDTVSSIESVGLKPIYDATVLGTHNFIANGTNLHNSIEQDSDVVILLHREDAYERESPRAGEADLIIAKHRNGPTATVTVAFQGHYSRFVDMAPAELAAYRVSRFVTESHCQCRAVAGQISDRVAVRYSRTACAGLPSAGIRAYRDGHDLRRRGRLSGSRFAVPRPARRAPAPVVADRAQPAHRAPDAARDSVGVAGGRHVPARRAGDPRGPRESRRGAAGAQPRQPRARRRALRRGHALGGPAVPWAGRDRPSAPAYPRRDQVRAHRHGGLDDGQRRPL
jgi:replicative DNA helicase